MEVKYVGHLGDDRSVVDAARVSFAKKANWKDAVGQQLHEKDVKLLDYLARNNHWSPFAHVILTVRCQAPIFVARQLAKHQVGLAWNEESRRYVDDKPQFYTPEVWRRRSEQVKQGSREDAVEVDPGPAYAEFIIAAEKFYNALLADEVCPEQARMVLPQSLMTTWIWTGSLVAFARVVALRTAPDAQAETAITAARIGRIAGVWFPASWAALRRHMAPAAAGADPAGPAGPGPANPG